VVEQARKDGYTSTMAGVGDFGWRGRYFLYRSISRQVETAA
jgi:hypothetical protein